MKSKVYLASDHGGFALKERIKGDLVSAGYDVDDLGPKEFDEEDDYPDFVIPLARRVVEEGRRGADEEINQKVLGVVICRSGGGDVIAANKVKGARAVLSFSPEHAVKTRTDDNANVLALAADFIDFEKAKSIVKAFLQTPFSFETRHLRRLKKIEDYESRN